MHACHLSVCISVQWDLRFLYKHWWLTAFGRTCLYSNKVMFRSAKFGACIYADEYASTYIAGRKRVVKRAHCVRPA